MRTYSLYQPQFSQLSTVNRIAVIDSTPIIPFAIKKLLTNYPYINVVGQCNDGFNALQLCRKVTPDIIIFDPSSGAANGKDVIQQLMRHNNDYKFILYFFESDDFYINEYIQMGIQGMVLKQSNINILLSAILTVGRGLTFMDSALIPHAQKETEPHKLIKKTFPLGLPKLSPRERQILTLISQGYQNKEMAKKLCISIKTVESHRLNLMKKLDAHNIVELLNWAKRLNIK